MQNSKSILQKHRTIIALLAHRLMWYFIIFHLKGQQWHSYTHVKPVAVLVYYIYYSNACVLQLKVCLWNSTYSDWLLSLSRIAVCLRCRFPTHMPVCPVSAHVFTNAHASKSGTSKNPVWCGQLLQRPLLRLSQWNPFSRGNFVHFMHCNVTK